MTEIINDIEVAQVSAQKQTEDFLVSCAESEERQRQYENPSAAADIACVSAHLSILGVLGSTVGQAVNFAITFHNNNPEAPTMPAGKTLVVALATGAVSVASMAADSYMGHRKVKAAGRSAAEQAK